MASHHRPSPRRLALAFGVLLLLAGACGSSDDEGTAEPVEPTAEPEVEVAEPTPEPTPEPTATPEPTPTNTPVPTPSPTPEPRPLDTEGPFTFEELTAEWANDVALFGGSSLADAWADASEVEPGVFAATTDAVTLSAFVDDSGLVTSLDIVPAGEEPLRIDGELTDAAIDAISAALWTLDPRASERLAEDLESIEDPERGQEDWVATNRDVFELADDRVTMHLGARQRRSFVGSTVVDVFGPPELLEEERALIGQEREWTVDWWGCTGEGPPCAVFVGSGLAFTRLLGDQVVLERSESTISGTHTVEFTDSCERSDWPESFTRTWTVQYDLTIEDDRVTGGTVSIDPIQERVQIGNRLCLSYGTVWDLTRG